MVCLIMCSFTYNHHVVKSKKVQRKKSVKYDALRLSNNREKQLKEEIDLILFGSKHPTRFDYFMWHFSHEYKNVTIEICLIF